LEIAKEFQDPILLDIVLDSLSSFSLEKFVIFFKVNNLQMLDVNKISKILERVEYINFKESSYRPVGHGKYSRVIHISTNFEKLNDTKDYLERCKSLRELQIEVNNWKLNFPPDFEKSNTLKKIIVCYHSSEIVVRGGIHEDWAIALSRISSLEELEINFLSLQRNFPKGTIPLNLENCFKNLKSFKLRFSNQNLGKQNTEFLEFVQKLLSSNTQLKHLKIEAYRIQKESSVWDLISMFPNLESLRVNVHKCKEEMERTSHFQIIPQMKYLKEKKLELNYLEGDRWKEFQNVCLNESKKEEKYCSSLVGLFEV